MESKIIQRYHDDVREGHQRESRTREKIQRYFYFPGMARKIRNYIRKCDKCQKNKIDTKKPFGKMQKWQRELTKPWRHITMDFVHMPETEGKGQVLVVTDRFSKFTILIPVGKTATTEEFYHLLWEQVFAVFGVPETITTDRDKIFRTNRWKNLMASLSVEQILSTSNHQRTDGQTERKMQEIQYFLRMF
jgi:integrase-like protein